MHVERRRIEIAWNQVCVRVSIPCFGTDTRCKIIVIHCGKTTVCMTISSTAYRVNDALGDKLSPGSDISPVNSSHASSPRYWIRKHPDLYIVPLIGKQIQ